MKLRCIIAAGLMFMAGLALKAQDGAVTVRFDETVHDFGNIDYKAGPQTHEFQFTNTGTTPVIIQNVSASCGCTTPGWSREPIPPGGRGFVKATYNPSGVMPFDKSLTVYSNGRPSPIVLRIKGRVVAAPPTVEEQYPQAFGALRLRSKELSLARIAQGAVKRDSVAIINTGDEALKLTFSNVPKYMTLEMVPASLQKNEKGFIRCTFNTASAKSKVWGIVKQPVNILINGKQSDAQLTVAATVEDDFSQLKPADYEQAPAVSVANSSHNFNTVKQGETVTAEFEITNTGKSPLLIRQSYTECACIKVTAPKSVKPGAKATVKAVLKTLGETGDKFYSVMLVTNAPSQSTTTFILTGKISD